MPRYRRLRQWTGAVAGMVTPLGWFTITATALAAVAWLRWGWVEAGVIAVAGLLLLLIALPFLIGGRNYIVRVGVEALRVPVGRPIVVDVFVKNPAGRVSLPALAELPVGRALYELPIPPIDAGERARLTREVATAARGVVTVGPLTLARRDPLGLLHREITWADWHRVHIHPRTAPLPAASAGIVHDLEGTASNRLTDADLSFHAVREYVHGDSPRHIHWKSTARTGTLMVRQYEESHTARSAVLFDSHRSQYADRAEFELAVSAAASLSVQAVNHGRERFIASAWQPRPGPVGIGGLEEMPSATAAALMDAWAELTPTEAPTREAASIDRLAAALARSRRPLSLVSIVTGSVTDFAAVRAAALVFPPGVAVRLVQCAVGSDPRTRLLHGARFLTIGALEDLPRLLMREANG